MKKLSFLLAYILLCGGIVSAQRFDAGGLVIDPSSMTAFDLFNNSQSHLNFGSARAAAMAGAMSSLGADISSMSINPAGLGMYQSNEISITPMLSFSRAKSNAAAFEGNSKNRFSCSSFGMVAKLRESSTGITAINLGFGYNRIADFNYKYSFASAGSPSNSSIADVFAGMLTAGNISRENLKNNYNNQGEFVWGRFVP